MITGNVKIALGALLLLCAPAVFGVGKKDPGAQTKGAESLSILVYIPGMVAGSPPYETLVAGAEHFAAAHTGVQIKVYEAGFNQAEWEEQLTSLAASGAYNLVLTSNPSLPEICAAVGKKFPNQKFIITDADFTGNPQISTYLFNQYEQSLYLGYLAGLITVSGMEHANPEKRIGFIAAQEYPLLNNHLIPGFLAGAQRVDPEITLDVRIIGNWFDATKTAELASSMITAGVDVFAAIAGGAVQGLFKTARERGAYVVNHNSNAYQSAPGIIVGCGVMKQKELVEEILADVLAGTISYGTSKIIGIKEGYLDFAADDPAYINSVPEAIRTRFNTFMEDMRTGRIEYTLPPL
jgi:simple sugar transport system substrate-binding protein